MSDIGPLRAAWIALMLYVVYAYYGVEALYIGLYGHIGLRAVGFCLTRIINPIAVLCLFSLPATAYLMYWSVADFGWWCFFLLLLSSTSVTFRNV